MAKFFKTEYDDATLGMLYKLYKQGYCVITRTENRDEVKISTSWEKSVTISGCKILGIPVPKEGKELYVGDIIDKIEWSKVKVNTPVWVWNGDIDPKHRKRHFSHYKNGNIHVFAGGGTSWTSDGTEKYAFGSVVSKEELDKHASKIK